MPIRVSELTEAQRPLKDRIYDWLRRHPGAAFTKEEIIVGVSGAGDVSTVGLILAFASMKNAGEQTRNAAAEYAPYQTALKELESEKRVRSGDFRGKTYYYVGEAKQS